VNETAPTSSPDGVLFDLLMAVMNSLDVWAAAAGDRALGIRWRDAVTMRMTAARGYELYEGMVAAGARDVALPAHAVNRLRDAWREMEPWPDAARLFDLDVPYAFVTNCSTALAAVAAGRSGLRPAFVLSAEEAGCYKPDPRIYLEGCRRLGTAPERTLFVAGAPYDADGAAAAGIPAAWVPRRPDVQPPDSAVWVVTSLAEVANGLAAGRS
jgi:2-haloacid dehalogenase